MADKKQRIQAVIGKNLSDIIYNMKNDVTNLASINEVKSNFDNSVVVVYVTHLQQDQVGHLLRYLNDHKGQIRSKLAKSMDTYKIPELQFKRDELFEQGAKIDRIIDSWHKED